MSYDVDTVEEMDIILKGLSEPDLSLVEFSEKILDADIGFSSKFLDENPNFDIGKYLENTHNRLQKKFVVDYVMEKENE